MRSKVKTGIIFAITVFVVLVFGFMVYNMATKNSEYKNALERNESIGGAWILDNRRTLLSIDDEKEPYSYSFMHDNREVSKGIIKKSKDNFYVLYDNDTKGIYAKIIPSYKEILFINEDLDIMEFEYFDEAQVVPPDTAE